MISDRVDSKSLIATHEENDPDRFQVLLGIEI